MRGDTLEVIAIYDHEATRIEFFGDEIEKIFRINPLTGDVIMELPQVAIYPASYYVAPVERMAKAIEAIEKSSSSVTQSYCANKSCWRRNESRCGQISILR